MPASMWHVCVVCFDSSEATRFCRKWVDEVGSLCVVLPASCLNMTTSKSKVKDYGITTFKKNLKI
jgi:hypothetical protein